MHGRPRRPTSRRPAAVNRWSVWARPMGLLPPIAGQCGRRPRTTHLRPAPMPCRRLGLQESRTPNTVNRVRAGWLRHEVFAFRCIVHRRSDLFHARRVFGPEYRRRLFVRAARYAGITSRLTGRSRCQAATYGRRAYPRRNVSRAASRAFKSLSQLRVAGITPYVARRRSAFTCPGLCRADAGGAGGLRLITRRRPLRTAAPNSCFRSDKSFACQDGILHFARGACAWAHDYNNGTTARG